MSRTKMIPACSAALEYHRKLTFQKLAQLFAPVVYFDPQERFFPVDLPSKLSASSLYRVDGERYKEYPIVVKPQGTIIPQDLVWDATIGSQGDYVTERYFMSVAGWDQDVKKIDALSPFYIPSPKPRIDDIHHLYSTGSINARLTMYATICAPLAEVPNGRLFDVFIAINPSVSAAIKEGLLINYYFHFPAAESPESEPSKLKYEGDWSGISVLLSKIPHPDRLAEAEPVLTCYYSKSRSPTTGIDYFVAGLDGFRDWQTVSKARDSVTGHLTHPIVYISYGRHNCYYEPGEVRIPFGPVFNATPAEIEEGYVPAPSGAHVVGESSGTHIPEPILALFPPAIIFEVCGLVCGWASGNANPVYPPADDFVRPGGFGGVPAGVDIGQQLLGSDNYPTGPLQKGIQGTSLTVNLVYLDLQDNTTRSWWLYRGTWGAATLEELSYWEELEPDKILTRKWSRFGSLERPDLAAWFLYNLHLNNPFGAAGRGMGSMAPNL